MEICEEVVIVGAGIAGLATAVGLQRVGIRCLVLEMSSELRATGAALTLFPNAWHALDALGVAHKLTPVYSIFQKGYFTYVSSGVIQQVSFTGTFNSGGMGVRAVHRRALLKALAEELPAGTIRFSSKLASIQTQNQDAILHLQDGSMVRAKVLIGCDGVHSVVAQWLGLHAPVHSGRSAVRGLAVFPQGHGLNHEVHQFLDDGIRAGFAPLNDQEVYWFTTNKSRPQDLEMERDPKLIQKDVLERVAKDFPEKFLEVVRNTDLGTLTSALLMFRWPWDLILGPVCKGNVTVAGDAMHPMTPDLGQGGCAALEDAVILARNLAQASMVRSKGKMELERRAVEEGLQKYVRERRWRGAGLITGAYLSGWVQLGSGWLVKFVRDKIFYRFSLIRLLTSSIMTVGNCPCFQIEYKRTCVRVGVHARGMKGRPSVSPLFIGCIFSVADLSFQLLDKTCVRMLPKILRAKGSVECRVIPVKSKLKLLILV